MWDQFEIQNLYNGCTFRNCYLGRLVRSVWMNFYFLTECCVLFAVYILTLIFSCYTLGLRLFSWTNEYYSGAADTSACMILVNTRRRSLIPCKKIPSVLCQWSYESVCDFYVVIVTRCSCAVLLCFWLLVTDSLHPRMLIGSTRPLREWSPRKWAKN